MSFGSSFSFCRLKTSLMSFSRSRVLIVKGYNKKALESKTVATRLSTAFCVRGRGLNAPLPLIRTWLTSRVIPFECKNVTRTQNYDGQFSYTLLMRSFLRALNVSGTSLTNFLSSKFCHSYSVKWKSLELFNANSGHGTESEQSSN